MADREEVGLLLADGAVAQDAKGLAPPPMYRRTDPSAGSQSSSRASSRSTDDLRFTSFSSSKSLLVAGALGYSGRRQASAGASMFPGAREAERLLRGYRSRSSAPPRTTLLHNLQTVCRRPPPFAGATGSARGLSLSESFQSGDVRRQVG
jgi:hypothetical protein